MFHRSTRGHIIKQATKHNLTIKPHHMNEDTTKPATISHLNTLPQSIRGDDMFEVHTTDTQEHILHQKDTLRHTLHRSTLEDSMFQQCTKNQNILLQSTSHLFIIQVFMNHQFTRNLNILMNNTFHPFTQQRLIIQN